MKKIIILSILFTLTSCQFYSLNAKSCFALCLAQCMDRQKPNFDIPACNTECDSFNDMKRKCANEDQFRREICETTCATNKEPFDPAAQQLTPANLKVGYDNSTHDPRYGLLTVSDLDDDVMVLTVDVEWNPTTTQDKETLVLPITSFPYKFTKTVMCSRYTFQATAVTKSGIGASMSDKINLLEAQPHFDGDPIKIEKAEYVNRSSDENIDIYIRLSPPVGYTPEQVDYDVNALIMDCPKGLGTVLPQPTPERLDKSQLLYLASFAQGALVAQCQINIVLSEMQIPECGNRISVGMKFKIFQIDCANVHNAPKSICSNEEMMIDGPLCQVQVIKSATILGGEPKALFSSDLTADDYDKIIANTTGLQVEFTFEPNVDRDKKEILYFTAAYGHGERPDDVISPPLLTNITGFARSCIGDRPDQQLVMPDYHTQESWGNSRLWIIDSDEYSQIPVANYTTCSNATPIVIHNGFYGVIYITICAVFDPRFEFNYYPYTINDKKTSGAILTRTIEPTVKRPHPSNVKTIVLAVAIPIVVIVLTAVTIILLLQRRSKRRNQKLLIEMESERKKYNDYVESLSNKDDYEIMRARLIIDKDRKLGSGAFGHVFMGKLLGKSEGAEKQHKSALAAIHMKFDNCDVAIKMLPDSADPYSKSAFLQEMDTMKSIGWHDNLVNILGCVTIDEPYCLIMEYCSDGNLLEYLRSRTKYMLKLEEQGIKYWEPNEEQEYDKSMILTKKQVLSFALQVSYGMEYLVNKGFVHRDLAARNVLVDNRVAKVADFGLTRKMDENSSAYTTKGGRLPFKWMALESLQSNEFTPMTDVWSYGVLLFELISFGGEPYANINPHEIQKYLEDGKRLQAPEHCDTYLYNIMSACWHENPIKRPKFGEIREAIGKELEDITTDSYDYLDPTQDYYQPLRKQQDYEDSRKMRDAEMEAKYGKRTNKREYSETYPLRQSVTIGSVVMSDSTDERISYETPKSASIQIENDKIPFHPPTASGSNSFFLPTIHPHADRATTPGSMHTVPYPINRRESEESGISTNSHSYENQDNSEDTLKIDNDVYANQSNFETIPSYVNQG